MNVDDMIVPVHNREYLLGVIAGAAAGVAASAPSSCASCVETPVEIFERLKINVTKADDKVQAQAEEKKKEDCCSVCTEDYTDEDQTVTTECNHLFHACCLATWVKTKKTCPICRKSVVRLFL